MRDMKKVSYVGNMESGTLEIAGGIPLPFVRGEVIEVPDHVILSPEIWQESEPVSIVVKQPETEV